jgi:hypothetical protein
LAEAAVAVTWALVGQVVSTQAMVAVVASLAAVAKANLWDWVPLAELAEAVVAVSRAMVVWATVVVVVVVASWTTVETHPPRYRAWEVVRRGAWVAMALVWDPARRVTGRRWAAAAGRETLELYRPAVAESLVAVAEGRTTDWVVQVAWVVAGVEDRGSTQVPLVARLEVVEPEGRAVQAALAAEVVERRRHSIPMLADSAALVVVAEAVTLSVWAARLAGAARQTRVATALAVAAAPRWAVPSLSPLAAH